MTSTMLKKKLCIRLLICMDCRAGYLTVGNCRAGHDYTYS